MCIFDDRPSGLNFETFNNRIVKASLYNTSEDAVQAINGICRKANLKILEPEIDYWSPEDSIAWMPDSFSGKAKLNVSQGDTWNEEVGSQFARERCLSKYHRAFDSRILKALEDARTLVVCFEHYCKKHGIDSSRISTEEEIKNKRFGDAK